MQKHPILYSFRRCPYAIRARIALLMGQKTVEIREIELRNKPQSMLEISPKGTVPILQLLDGTVIDESLDIMLWALNTNVKSEQKKLIDTNDTTFKAWLDRYKYYDRYPEHPQHYYREQCEIFLHALNERLQKNHFLMSDQANLIDVAIFPFVRQFSSVDNAWFEQSQYTALRRWLDNWLTSEIFLTAMNKYNIWHPDQPPVLFSA